MASNMIDVRFFFKKNNGGTEKFYQMVLIKTNSHSLLITRYGKKAQTENGGTVSHDLVRGDLLSKFESKKREKEKGGYLLDDLEVSASVIRLPTMSHINCENINQQPEFDRVRRLVDSLLTKATRVALFDEMGLGDSGFIVNFAKTSLEPVIPLSERDSNWGAW